MTERYLDKKGEIEVRGITNFLRNGLPGEEFNAQTDEKYNPKGLMSYNPAKVPRVLDVNAYTSGILEKEIKNSALQKQTRKPFGIKSVISSLTAAIRT